VALSNTCCLRLHRLSDVGAAASAAAVYAVAVLVTDTLQTHGLLETEAKRLGTALRLLVILWRCLPTAGSI